MKYAIIKTGGKQYLVEEGQQLDIEKLEGEENERVEFSDVLLMVEDEAVAVGTPLVEGASVTAELITHGKGKKVQGLKYKRGGHRTKFGHRQSCSRIEITKINHGT